MLTGDHVRTAQAVAEQTGISHFKAGMMPSDKAAFIQELQKEGKTVAMVGDGINDAHALAQADVSIAMGKGSDIAMDVAKITIISSDLLLVPKALRLSRLTVKTIRQNLFWAFIYNVIRDSHCSRDIVSYIRFPAQPDDCRSRYGTEFCIGSKVIACCSNAGNCDNESLPAGRNEINISTNQRINKNMNTLKFKTNINCGGCIAKVTPFLDKAEGIASWSVDTNVPEKILTVKPTICRQNR